MAYRFNGTTDYVEFATSPFTGYTVGAVTFAILLKRAVVSTLDFLVLFGDSSMTAKLDLYTGTDDRAVLEINGNGGAGTVQATSTSIWYLLAVTRPAATKPRHHTWNGTSWNHTTASSGATNSIGIVSGDRLRVSHDAFGQLAADVVCVGVKKSDSTDLAIETLSPTNFSAWRSFGFDWLIGFDTSLQAAGVLQDQASPGTGDQAAISGTSVVSDPAGWSWGAAAPKSGFLAFT